MRIEPTRIVEFESPTRIVSTLSPTHLKTSTIENGFSVYRDKEFCIAITYPSSWNQYGESGAFTLFTPDNDRGAYSITNVFLGESPTLDLALDNLKGGALGQSILSVKGISVDQQPATWVSLDKQARFKFLVIVITPDCGMGTRSIFISSESSDEHAFVDFVNNIKFNR